MTSFDLTLYLVTDRRMPKEGFETVVEEAIRGGVTLVQLREKEGDTGLLYERARRLKEVTDRYHIPLIIDDRIDIMLAVDAATTSWSSSTARPWPSRTLPCNACPA